MEVIRLFTKLSDKNQRKNNKKAEIKSQNIPASLTRIYVFIQTVVSKTTIQTNRSKTSYNFDLRKTLLD